MRPIDADRLMKELKTLPMMSNWGEAFMPALISRQPTLKLDVPDTNVGDTISRQTEADARRYAFGNDEFSLEAAYHDCKLVFDGIIDDDSFQEADTGLILYYANEIIYALKQLLSVQPTIEPRKTGHWAGDFCSVCGVSKYNWFTVVSEESKPFGTWKYCPNCGAKMEEENG